MSIKVFSLLSVSMILGGVAEVKSEFCVKVILLRSNPSKV